MNQNYRGLIETQTFKIETGEQPLAFERLETIRQDKIKLY